VQAIRKRAPAQNDTETAHVPECAGTKRHTTLEGCAAVPSVPPVEEEEERPPQLPADADRAETMQQ
jgi:hypothetical protein